MKDTIVALSTGYNSSAIGIIRITGKNSLKIVKKIATIKIDPKARYMHKTNIIDIKDQKVLDEAVFCYFQAPNSYTGEDMIELFCHGSLPVLNRILDILMLSGARMAEAGEFTKRAFLNGKIDLIKAEAIQELISAKNILSAKVACQRLLGKASQKVLDLRKKVLDLSSHIEASIDFPEEVDFLSTEDFIEQINAIYLEAKEFIANSQLNKMINEGLKIVIVGPPNVGKSTLLNCLLETDRAIVSEIAGTTRDTIEEFFELDGKLIKLIDTAGIHMASDKLENIGIKRAIDKAKDADLILLVFEQTKKLSDQELNLIKMFENKKKLLIINKADKIKSKKKIDFAKEFIFISAKTKKGIVELKSEITKICYNIDTKADELLFLNTRQLNKMIIAEKYLKALIKDIKKQRPLFILASHLKEILKALSQLSGDSINEEVVNNIFDKFCVGK